MIRQLFKIALRRYCRLFCANSAQANLIADLRLPRREFARGPNNSLVLKRWDLHLCGPLAILALRNYKTLTLLHERFRSTFSILVNHNCLRIRFDDITLDATDDGDIAVIEEIFVDELYRFSLPFAEPAVVWDVGMNVGYASIYLARCPQVSRVFSCELFRPTFDKALHNFSLNPAFGAKITPWCEGVSNETTELELPYADQLQSILSLDGPMLHHPEVSLRAERVNVTRASDMLRRIKEQAGDMPIVLKMDCEGAEGKVLAELETKGTLRHISLIMMEWHGTLLLREIEAILARSGFAITVMRFKYGEVGALSAFRC